MNKRIVAASLIAAFLVATAAAVAARFVVTSGAEPIVSDSRTGLVWQGCAAGQTGEACTGSAGTKSWQQALAYCEGLTWGGYSDWYLPNVTELSSIVDDHHISPVIDPVAFPNTPSSYFWSSSSYAGSASDAWYVDFSFGYVYYVGKSYGHAVRCVRRGL